MGFWNLFAKKKDAEISRTTIIAELSLSHKKYILSEFHIEFNQDVDVHGNPLGHTSGGIMTLTMNYEPDDLLVRWSVSERMQNDGEVNFFSLSDSLSKGALYKIVFRKAHCAYFERIKLDDNSLSKIRMTVYPRSVFMDNEELENDWKLP